jgi:hypothetical protein
MVVVHFFELEKLVAELEQDISYETDQWPPVLRIRPILQRNWADKQGMTEHIVGLAIRFHHSRRQCLFSFFYPVDTFRQLFGTYWSDGESRHARAVIQVELLEFEVRKYIEEALPYFVISTSILDLGDAKLERGTWKDSPLENDEQQVEE